MMKVVQAVIRMKCLSRQSEQNIEHDKPSLRAEFIHDPIYIAFTQTHLFPVFFFVFFCLNPTPCNM